VSKTWNRTDTWLALIAVAVGFGLTALLGLFAYMASTPPLHEGPDAVSSVVQTPPSERWTAAVQRGQQIMRADLTAQNLPGLSVAVGIDGEVVWAEGFGWADLEHRVPVAPETRFRLGTASVTLTSAAAGLLLEQDRLRLDADIQTYVPAFPEDQQWPVTVRQLMAHTAGIRNDGGDEGPLLAARCERPVDALHAFADRPLLFEPGTAFRYSSYGWILLSAAIEAAANQPFLAFMQAQIFEPLGMHATTADSATEPLPNRATPYFPRFAADPRYGPDLMRPLDYSCYAGSSVFLSTPSDMVRFAMAITRGTLLQPATVTLLQSPQSLVSGEATGYGLGWDLETATLAGTETRAIGHDGDSLGGMVTSLLTFPEHGLVVSVMSNTSYADTAAVALKIAQAFAEQEKSAGRT